MENKKNLLYIKNDFVRGLSKVVEGLNLMIGGKNLSKHFQIHVGDPYDPEKFTVMLTEAMSKNKTEESKD